LSFTVEDGRGSISIQARHEDVMVEATAIGLAYSLSNPLCEQASPTEAR
jgi:hypothetical protein